MTLPGAPLPGIGSLLKAIRGPAFTGEPWFNNRPDFKTHLYWRGRLALAAGIKALGRARGADAVTVWLPDYFCNEALEPLRRLPVNLRFYPVKEDLTPPWPWLEENVGRDRQVKALVLVHYFGFPNDAAGAMAFCRRHGMALVEDAAHLLRPYRGMGVGDLLFFSPRKLLPVPAGAILVSSPDLEPYLEDDSRYPRAKDTLPWVCLRLAQKLMLRWQIPWHKWRSQCANDRPAGELALSTSGEFYSCDAYNLRLLRVLAPELHEITRQRRSHFHRLAAWLDGLSQARPLFALPPEAEEICPYIFPLLIEGKIDRLLFQLQASGIPASQWPVFPPEVWDYPDRHRTALGLRERLVLLPLHQSLTPAQVERMGGQLRGALQGLG